MTTDSIKKIDKVAERLFKEIVKRILSAVQPERIILFGSFAHGKPTRESDLDILVIMNSQLPRYKRAIPIYKALAGIFIPKDIVVYAPEEIEEWENVPQAFITTAVREGKVIYEKSKADLVKNWLEKARRDLITAKNGLEYSEHFTDIICFHAQQAGEKYIKAYLIFHEINFPKTHSLADLLLLAAKKDQDFLSMLDEANMLTPYAVEIHYGESEPPLLEDAKSAIEIAEQMRNFVFEKLPGEIVTTAR